MHSFADLLGASIVFMPLAIFGLSIIGSTHCVAMCGPLCLAFNKKLPDALKYHASKWVGYMIPVSIVYFFKEAIVDLKLFQTVSQIHGLLLSFLMIITALVMLFFWRFSRQASPAFLSKHLANTLSKFKLVNTYGIGFANGLMPCGWFYSFLVLVAFAPSYLHAILWTGTFWLPGSLVLVYLALGASKIQFRLKKYLPALIAVTLLCVSSYQFTVRVLKYQDLKTSQINQGAAGKDLVCRP